VPGTYFGINLYIVDDINSEMLATSCMIECKVEAIDFIAGSEELT